MRRLGYQVVDLVVNALAGLRDRPPSRRAWQAALGAAAAELATLRWLRELFGLPETAGGLFVDGGSSANLYGLVAARRAVLDDRLEGAALYASDQVHSWIGRAAGLLGLRPDQVRLLGSDHEFRLLPDTLAPAVAADRASGRRPFCAAGRDRAGRLARPRRPQVAVSAAGGRLRAGPRRRPAGVGLLRCPDPP
jgi:hypothetical protein